MKYVLVFVVLPTFWLPGREQHVEFESLPACQEALKGIQLEQGHWKYCVPKGADEWFYERLKPQG